MFPDFELNLYPAQACVELQVHFAQDRAHAASGVSLRVGAAPHTSVTHTQEKKHRFTSSDAPRHFVLWKDNRRVAQLVGGESKQLELGVAAAPGKQRG